MFRRKMKFNEEEYRLLRDLLLNFRNAQIRARKSTDLVNELMYKLMK